MVRGDTAGDEVECGVWVRECFGGMLAGPDVQAALGGAFLDAIEHGGGDVGSGDVEAGGCKAERGVACAGGDVEGFGARRDGEALEGGGDVACVFEDVTLAVAVAAALELFLGGLLDGVEAHGKLLMAEVGLMKF